MLGRDHGRTVLLWITDLDQRRSGTEGHEALREPVARCGWWCACLVDQEEGPWNVREVIRITRKKARSATSVRICGGPDRVPLGLCHLEETSRDERIFQVCQIRLLRC